MSDLLRDEQLPEVQARKARGLALRMSNSISGCLGAGNITLKALANFSPGFVLKPWVTNASKELVATPELCESSDATHNAESVG